MEEEEVKGSEKSVADEAWEWLKGSQKPEGDPELEASEAEFSAEEVHKIALDLKEKFHLATQRFPTNAFSLQPNFSGESEERVGRKVFLVGDNLYDYVEEEEPESGQSRVYANVRRVLEREDAQRMFERALDLDGAAEIEWDGRFTINVYPGDEPSILENITYFGGGEYRMIEQEGDRFRLHLKNTPRVVTKAEEILQDLEEKKD